ncbi:MAG: alpha/beta fold hydrolase [Acidobacteriota bacterium]|nr:alpha/beta fold hydrolase [Acidobacteriota bacterium]
MYPAGNLFIPVEHGRLEAIIKEPRVERRGAALVLHPHPLHGGTMHNKVAARTARALNDAGCVALRINFRGAGRSTGSHDYARGGEQEDARAGLDYLAENYPALPIILAGFSFGARVGLEVGIRDPRVRALVAVGTPVSIAERGYDFSFLNECRKPVLFVHGERDEFGDVGRLKEIVAAMPAPARARLLVIPSAGHFFDEQLDELVRVSGEWAEEILKTND